MKAPNSFSILVLESSGKPIPNLAIRVKLFAHKKNDYYIVQAYRFSRGQVLNCLNPVPFRTGTVYINEVLSIGVGKYAQAELAPALGPTYSRVASIFAKKEAGEVARRYSIARE